jgi:hypothetical protein
VFASRQLSSAFKCRSFKASAGENADTSASINPDKGFFVVFRFYGPLEGYINKTWVLNDFELIE